VPLHGVRRLVGDGKPLPGPLRSEAEGRFGTSLAHVRIHDGPTAHELARSSLARAVTVGPDIVFGAGQYRTGSPHGRELLGHELAHVVQQTGRRRSAVPAGAAHEAAAEASGRAFAGGSGRIAAGPGALEGAQRAPLSPKEIARLKRHGFQPVGSKAASTSRPSAPTSEYDVPTHRLFRWRGSPAPAEHVQQHGTTPADRAKAQHYGTKYGPKDAPHLWTAGHEKPASHTPPGERPWLRVESAAENKAGGTAVSKLNRLRRQDPTHRDPTSPSYTRPTKPRYGSKAHQAQKAAASKPAVPDPVATTAKGAPPGADTSPRTAATDVAPKVDARHASDVAPKVDAPHPSDVAPSVDAPHPSVEAPDVHPSVPSPAVPAGASAGFLDRLASKLGALGVIGDLLLVHQIAQELEWHDTLSDPKWGLERTDMFGETWYRHDVHSGTWFTAKWAAEGA
jgi:hypothetical protein